MADLTVREVVAELKVHEETVRRWLKDGRIKGYRLGGTKAGWRIPEVEIDRLRSGNGHQASLAHD